MTEEEKYTFLYGYWDKSFYDKATKSSKNGKALILLLAVILSSLNPSLKSK